MFVPTYVAAGIILIAAAVGAIWAVRPTPARREQYRRAAQLDQLELGELQEALRGFDVRVFGSCVRAAGGLYARHTRSSGLRVPDVDLVVVVDDEVFEAWKGLVYGPGAIHPYDETWVTRHERQLAAEQVLGREFPRGYGRNFDIFLFSKRFVRGEVSVPAWDDGFRGDVLRDGRKLASLCVANISPWQLS